MIFKPSSVIHVEVFKNEMTCLGFAFKQNRGKKQNLAKNIGEMWIIIDTVFGFIEVCYAILSTFV